MDNSDDGTVTNSTSIETETIKTPEVEVIVNSHEEPIPKTEPAPVKRVARLTVYQDVVSLFGHQYMAFAVMGPTLYVLAADQSEGPLTLVASGPATGGLSRLSGLSTARLVIEAGDQNAILRDNGDFESIGDWIVTPTN